jgi:hypothetical protein
VLSSVPRISFGLIVLNGEPFIRYNLRALYPFAHEIVVAEGASPRAAHMATESGHSVDGTLEELRRFAAEEDPEHKLIVVTAEDDGHPDGFWPGEKDQQSQAYAARATGDWLWQVDVDEFYRAEDMVRVCRFLLDRPSTTCLTFHAHHFWGGFDYVLEGGLFMRPNFQGEPWGAYRRVFKWGPGYRYASHRPPTVLDPSGRDVVDLEKRNLSGERRDPVHMYHYTNVFVEQVVPKGRYYANQGWAVGIAQRRNFERFAARLTPRRALRIYDHAGTHNWLTRFRGTHPSIIETLRRDLRREAVGVTMRPNADIEAVLSSPAYRVATRALLGLEWSRAVAVNTRARAIAGGVRLARDTVLPLVPSALVRVLPPALRRRIERARPSGRPAHR